MTVEEKKAKYEIIKEGKYADYVIINRHTSFQPYIVCWAFDEEDYTWGQGHYFETLNEAKFFLYGKEQDALEALRERIEEALKADSNK